jgi:hypothetical protein
MSVPTQNVINYPRQVSVPINQQMKEFVEAGDNWRHHEANLKNAKCLVTYRL